MSKPLQTIGLAIGALIGLLVLAAIALSLFLDINAYKPRFEAAASKVFGMEVKIGGPLEISLFPTLVVTLHDVHVHNRGAEIVTARRARIGIDFLTLFHKRVQIENVVLEHPSISIEKARDGRFNFEKPVAARGSLPNLNLEKVTFADGTFRYADKQTGAGFEAANCRLGVSHLQLAGRGRPGVMKQLSFAAELACGAVRTQDYVASGLKLSVAGQRGVFDLTPLTMRVYAGHGVGRIRADFTGAVPLYHVRYSLSQFHVESFLKPLSPKTPAVGLMDFTANLSMQGKTVNALRQTAQGQLSLRGKNLILNGRDLDQEFAQYESSQHFNLVDLGALFFAGPAGLVLTKGYNFASVLHGSGGHSDIPTLVSDWTVKRGVAQSRDVAMATKENRVALHGKLDFVNERFDDVTVALIDARGCSKVQQTIHGAFRKPVVDKPDTLKSLTGPVARLLEQVMRPFNDGACEVFYAGSVASPK